MLATEETFFFGDQVINSGLPPTIFTRQKLLHSLSLILEPAGPVAIDFVFALRSNIRPFHHFSFVFSLTHRHSRAWSPIVSAVAVQTASSFELRGTFKDVPHGAVSMKHA